MNEERTWQCLQVEHIRVHNCLLISILPLDIQLSRGGELGSNSPVFGSSPVLHKNMNFYQHMPKSFYDQCFVVRGSCSFCWYFAKWINSFMISIITDIEKSNIANSLIGRSV